MAVNPFVDRGTPIAEQGHPFQELVVQPYSKDRVDEYSRLRCIWSYGLENEQWYFYHQLARHTDNEEVKKLVGQIRRTEDQHRSGVSFFFDPSATIPQLTIAYEHLAVDLTAACCLDEPDPYIKQVFDYGLLEDFDHLFRFTVLLQRLENKDATEITRGLVEHKPGRATWDEHLHPMDTLRNHYDARTADPLTRLHAMAILGAEQQTRQYYASDGYWLKDREARRLYAEIGQIEEQHVSQYEAIIDPRPSWLEMAIDHEYLEIYTYSGFLMEEKNKEMKAIWEERLSDELEHFKLVAELCRRLEGKDARQMWPEQMPKPIVLKPTVDYVNQVLATQVELRASGKDFVPMDMLPPTWPSAEYKKLIGAGEAPSKGFQRVQKKAA